MTEFTVSVVRGEATTVAASQPSLAMAVDAAERLAGVSLDWRVRGRTLEATLDSARTVRIEQAR